MASTMRWTSTDLDTLPQIEGNRYEIIDGVLHVSKQPHWHHQYVCSRITTQLQLWSEESGAGQAVAAPGIIFSEDNDVAPDLVWISKERLIGALDDAGHLRVAPELIIEVLSPGRTNERRDREAKLNLYSRRGVQEYWIVDWRLREVQIYRRGSLGLQLVSTVQGKDTLETTLLPGFACVTSSLFEHLPS